MTTGQDKPSVKNPCSVCGVPIFGSVIGTGDGSMTDGGSFAHPECYWQQRAEQAESALARSAITQQECEAKLDDGDAEWPCKKCGAWTPDHCSDLGRAKVPPASACKDNTVVLVREAIFNVLDGRSWNFDDDEQRVDFADQVVSWLPGAPK